MDFSSLNLQYLVQARDLAKQDRLLAATLLNFPDEMTGMLADLSPQSLSQIANIKIPLLLPHQEIWWWSRLLTSLERGRIDEVVAVSNHLPLIIVR